jgi:hypothetical protein
VDVQYPLYVVSNITVNPGVGASYAYDYTYVGAKRTPGDAALSAFIKHW